MRFLRRLLVALVALAALLVGALALAAYLVDVNGLIARYQPLAVEAATTALNREVELGPVKATWFPVLGLRAEAIAVSAKPVHTATAAGGEGQLLGLKAVEVGLAVWPALRSLGRDIQISTVRLEEPVIRVVRFEDGSLDIESVGPPPSEKVPPPPPAEDGPGIADRFRRAEVGSIQIVDGTVRFEDRTPDGLGAVEVRRLSLATGPVGLGLPIAATVNAALASAEPNLRIELATGPLAAKVSELGAPSLSSVRIHAEALPLSIVPVSAGAARIADATLDADLELIPEGVGGLRLAGPLAVRGLRIDGEGGPGSRFDVALGLAVGTSTGMDRFVLDGTEVAVGPMRTGVRGTVSLPVAWTGLAVETLAPFSVRELVAIAPGPRRPVPEGRLGLSVGLGDGNLERLAAQVSARWSGLSYAEGGLRVTGETGLDLKLSGTVEKPRIAAALDFKDLAVAGEGFDKQPGLPGRLEADVIAGADAVRVERSELKLGAMRVGATVIYPLGGGTIDANMKLSPLELPPFLASIGVSAPSLPLGSTVEAEIGYQAPASAPQNGAVRLTKFRFAAADSDLEVTGGAARLDPLSLELVGRSKKLDLDRLLPPPSEEAKPAAETSGSGPLLPPSARAAKATVDLQVAELRYRGVNIEDVDVRLQLADGRLNVVRTRLQVFGGRVSADGTTIDLGSDPLGFSLEAKLQGLQGKQMFDGVFGLGEALSGRLDADLNLAGRGLTLAALAPTLAGAFSMALAEGRLDGLNLLGSTALPLRDALDFAKKTAPLGLGDPGATTFKTLAARFEVKGGRMTLARPLALDLGREKAEFQGSVGLDGGLDLQGTMQLSPALLTQMTGGTAKPKKPLPVTFRLGCTLMSPCVDGVDAKSTAEALALQLGGKAAEEAARRLKDKTGIDVKGAEAAARRAKAEAEEKARAAEAEARRRAQEEANKAKAKAEAEAERAMKKAEAELEEAKKRAAEKAKGKARSLLGR